MIWGWSGDSVMAARRPARIPGQYAEARVIACYTLRRGLHSGFEILVGRIDEEPFSQHLMRHQGGEFRLNGGVMLVAGRRGTRPDRRTCSW